MRFTILWEIPLSTFSYGKSPPQEKIFPMENSLLFSPTPYGRFPQEKLSPMGNPHYFSPSPPLWEISQKNLEKKFFFGTYGQLFPQKWGCPLGRGGIGGYLPPPYGIYGGGDYLFGCLFGYLLGLHIQCAFDFILSCCQ